MTDADDPVVELLTTRQVAELLRVSYRQLDWWVRSGFLTVGDVTPGSGYPRRWWPDEVNRARAFAALVHVGISPAAVAAAMPSLMLDGARFAALLTPAVWIVGELP